MGAAHLTSHAETAAHLRRFTVPQDKFLHVVPKGFRGQDCSASTGTQNGEPVLS
jgi:hypothetical protein